MPSAPGFVTAALGRLAGTALVLLLAACAHGGAAGGPAPAVPTPPQEASPARADIDLDVPPSHLRYLPPGRAAGNGDEARREAVEPRGPLEWGKGASGGMILGFVGGAAVGAATSDEEVRPLAAALSGILGMWIGYLGGAIHDAAHGDFHFPPPPLLPSTKEEYPEP